MTDNAAKRQEGVRKYSMTYYDRVESTNIDGTPIFKNDEDEQNEREVAEMVEQKWKCTIHSFGHLSVIDWWVERAGRPVGYLEVKTRTHATTTYATVFLNLRKWLALTMAELGTGHPGVFMVRFTDAVRWIAVRDVDAKAIVVGGCSRIVKSRNDREPVIEVPVTQMRSMDIQPPPPAAERPQ